MKRELANLGLVPEEWGGQTIFVHTSAKRGDGVAQLLEMTALQSDILELKANPNRAALGVIVEGRLDRGRGPVATALIQAGTLKEGDAVVVGSQSGRVRAMFSDRGKKAQRAGPSDPVEILGLSGVPQAGETLLVVADERKARQIATVRVDRDRLKAKGAARVTLEDLHKQIATGEVKELRLVLKADVQGSVEALTESLEHLSTDEVKLGVAMGFVELIQSLETIAGVHGVGRIDMVENRTGGAKSREIYEAPADVVLHAAHRELQAFVVPRDLERLTWDLGVRYADLVYKGLWFTATRHAIDALVAHVQARVTGTIRVRLSKGECRVIGRQSPFGDVRAASAT